MNHLKINKAISIIFLFICFVAGTNIFRIEIMRVPMKAFGNSDVFFANVIILLLSITLFYGFLRSRKWILPVYGIIYFSMIVYLSLSIFDKKSILTIDLSSDDIVFIITSVFLPLIVLVYLVISSKDRKDE